MPSINQSRDYYVVKRNDLVQHSMYSMTTQQQKLILYFISKIRPSDEAGTLYSISIQEFCDICGIDKTNGMNYINIKNSLDRIDAVKAWILKDGKYERFQWFNRLIVNSNDGTIQVSFHITVWDKLYDLHKKYTRYQLINVLPMRSRYSIRIYELCASYRYAGRFEMSLDKFRRLIGVSEEEIDNFRRLIGVSKEEKKYTKNSHLKARILDKAEYEINNFTNLHVSYTLIKEGRSYTRIYFKIEEKSPIGEALAHTKQRERLNK